MDDLQLDDLLDDDDRRRLAALNVERIDDLLTDEERADLAADLAEINRCRRRAYEISGEWPMP